MHNTEYIEKTEFYIQQVRIHCPCGGVILCAWIISLKYWISHLPSPVIVPNAAFQTRLCVVSMKGGRIPKKGGYIFHPLVLPWKELLRYCFVSKKLPGGGHVGLMTRGSLLLWEPAVSWAEIEICFEDGLENTRYSVIYGIYHRIFFKFLHLQS